MNQIKVYNTICYRAYMMEEMGRYLTLEPWTGNSTDYEGESDEGTLYNLPEGCELSRNNFGTLCIYNGNDYCEFFSENGVPMILLNGEPVVLEKAGV